MLHELPFYNKYHSKYQKGYAKIYNVEVIDSKDPSVQLTISKSSMEDFFEGLLDETKGFKYQITPKVFLSRYRENGDREFAPAPLLLKQYLP